MKKLLTLLTSLLLSLSVSADNMPIDINRLPQKAVEFTKSYYPKSEITMATLDRELSGNEYKVFLSSGTTIEFNRNGEWLSIECKAADTVPQSLLSRSIIETINTRFKSSPIIKAEKERDGCEIKLKSGMELEFNKNGKLVGVDN